MTQKQAVMIPDIGGSSGSVIEILVKVGDKVDVESPLITLEGDKATMDVPSDVAGEVASIDVKMGQSVQEGDPCITLLVEASATPDQAASASNEAKPAAKGAKHSESYPLPDFGGGSGVKLLEWLVKEGDTVSAEQSLATLEGEKATMDLPSPAAGTVKALLLKVGQEVSEGDQWITLEVEANSAPKAAPKKEAPKAAAPVAAAETKHDAPSLQDTMLSDVQDDTPVYAGPSVRAYAREYGVMLSRVKGSGPKGRVRISDVRSYISAAVAHVQSGKPIATEVKPDKPAVPPVDFAKFGPVREEALPRIKQISGPFLQQAWQTVPHVTQMQDVDITDLDQHRKKVNKALEALGTKSSPLIFMMKALVAALKEHPSLCSSLSVDGKGLILKDYYHIGVAVDTPHGLVVAVIRDVDQKDIATLSQEVRAIAEKARTKGLSPQEMQGGCMTISSLGGLGAGPFTPIVNMPEVAILGVSKAETRPIWDKKENAFVPKLIQPLSLSYDHRVIDGAEGARFMQTFANYLAAADAVMFEPVSK